MVLLPLNPNPSQVKDAPPVTVWSAIERQERQAASKWFMIAQPDHAALAGDLAAAIQSADFPRLDHDVLQAIALHDDGWAPFDADPAVRNGQPLSFLDIAPPIFVRAWIGSIERAQQVAAISGILVSEHFRRLGQLHLQSYEDSPEDARLIHEFLANEATRQARLRRQQQHSDDEIAVLVDVLQFCDLLSLYLCCGSRENVAFPQSFHGRTPRLEREGELCRITPALFGQGVSLAVRAREFPGLKNAASIPFLLA